MKPTSQYSLLLVIISVCLLSYCSKATTSFERDNLSDPDNPSFEIQPLKEFQTQIQPDKVIRISWTDSSNYVDGYVLSKSLDGATFELLDTVEATTRSYNDVTGQFTKNTSYSLYSFRSIENGYNVSETLIADISFGEINLDTYSASSDTSTFNLSWKFGSSWPFIVVSTLTLYTDPFSGHIISSMPLDTIYHQETSYNRDFEKTFYTYSLSFDAYLDYENLEAGNVFNNFVIYPYDALSIDFSPYFTSSQVVDESTVSLNWKDNSTFEDGFEILRTNSYSDQPFEVIATLPPNTTSFVDTLAPFINATHDPFSDLDTFYAFYRVRAIKGNSITSSNKSEKVTLTAPKPTLTVKEENANSVKLSWSISSANYVKNYILERSIDGSEFQAYKTFDKNTTEYTVTELDTSKQYSFRVRTIKSQPSNALNIKHFRTITEIETLNFPGATSIRSSKTDKYLVASAGINNPSFSSNDVVVFDLENGTEIYRTTPFSNPVDGVDINADKNLIAMVSSKDRSVKIMDFVADTIVYELLYDSNNSFFDIEFSPDGNYFYTVTAFGSLSKFSLLTKTNIFKSSTTSITGTNRSLSVSPTGDSIAVSVFGIHQLFSKEGNLLNFQTLSAKGSYSQGVKFSKSGEFLATIRNSDLGTVQITSDGYALYNFRASYADIHYSNSYLATFYEGQLSIINLYNKRELLALKYTNSTPKLTQLRFSNSQDYFYFGTNSGIKLYELSDSKSWFSFDN